MDAKKVNPVADSRLASADSRLTHFPVSFFSIIMGLSGLCIAWEKSLSMMSVSLPLPPLLAGFALLVFTILVVIYAMKIVKQPQAVLEELRHPIKLNFFAAIPISLLLLSVATLPLYAPLSKVLWASGSVLQLVALLYILNAWIHHEQFKVEHLNPAWFIPAVGNVLVPLSGVAHGHPEISWFFFSVGMLFWIILLTIVFNRIIVHQPLPAKLLPTLFILIAPPAVGFVAYIKLNGSLDSFAHVLYYVGLFFTLLLFTQINRFARLPFFLSSWAYSFPLSAITVSSWVMFEKTGLPGIKLIALGLLVALSLLVAMLLIKTIQAIRTGDICLPE